MAGIWDVTIETFIKAPPQVWTFSGSDDDLRVVVDMGAEAAAMGGSGMDITEAKAVGSTFTWVLSVTKPGRFTAKGTAQLAADGMSFEGSAKAGILPGGRFKGTKRADAAVPSAQAGQSDFRPAVTYDQSIAQPAPAAAPQPVAPAPAPQYGQPVVSVPPAFAPAAPVPPAPVPPVAPVPPAPIPPQGF